MSEMTLSSLKERLGEIGARAAWAQWSALGAGTLHEGRSASAIIDPEALLLLSLHLIPEERRLRDLARWWAEVGSGLLSVQRTKTLAKDFPPDVQERLHEYSRWATRAGDKRWKKYASEGTKNDSERDRKGPEDPQLRSPASLLLQLRAGFGVSAKADVLAFLLGIEGQTATTRQATEATGYSRATISGALEDLVRADFIEKSGGRPGQYPRPRLVRRIRGSVRREPDSGPLTRGTSGGRVPGGIPERHQTDCPVGADAPVGPKGLLVRDARYRSPV